MNANEELIGEEGLTTFMYLNTSKPPHRDLRSGHAIFDIDKTLALPWVQPAARVRAGYAAVKGAPRGMKAALYASFTKSRLTEAFVRELLEQDIEREIAILKRYFLQYEQLPCPRSASSGRYGLHPGWGTPGQEAR